MVRNREMTEDPTKDLTDGEKLSLILTKLSDVETRLAKLEAQAEDRSRETRPKLDLIIKEVADVRSDVGELKEGQSRLEKELRSTNRKFDVLNKDLLAMKADLRDFDERPTELERRPN
jgi:septal ring factor EnvC (AmiA/AmiB activator)